MASRFQTPRSSQTSTSAQAPKSSQARRKLGAAYDRFAPGRFTPRPVQTPQPVRPPAPTAAVVDAVLRYHDVAVDQGGQRSLLRLSEDRLADAEVVRALAGQTDRARRVAILWNERESEIIRVLEAA
ncbi:MAG: hypothetical protein U1C74_15805 [Phenylobacterium sp.]|nr:hypothetical protein [Phenylobacterium sp.]